MNLDEETDFDVVASGLHVRARLDAMLNVSVRRKMYVVDDKTKQVGWFWLFVSSVTVYLPVSKAEAMRLVMNHLAFHDQALIPTAVAIWDLWDQYPEKTGSAPPQGKDVN